MLTSAVLLLCFAILLLLGKHWVQVTRRDAETAHAAKLRTALDWRAPRRRATRKRAGFFS
jgi:hypothetical protein